MKRVNNCVVENCIPTPSSCVEWNGGDIEYLGICNGDSLNNIVWEIVTKLQDIAGQDLSSFDIDDLLAICDQKAPTEVTLISILNLLKGNDVCLKDYIIALQDQINTLSATQKVSVNLKCYADFDNLGNALSITRDQLDQLVIDKLCLHDGRLTYVEGAVTSLQSQIDEIANDSTVNEATIATCVDPLEKPTSSQVISVATKVCDIDTLLNNLIVTVTNLTATVEDLTARVTFMEENCCALTCDDIELGFNATFNEDNSAILIKFTWGAGTSIPAGFVDEGSIGTITDIDGNVETFNIDIVDNFSNNNETEVPITGLNLNGDLQVSITANIGTDTLNCQKCIAKTVKPVGCSYCQICNTGEDGDIIIVVQGEVNLSSSVTAGTTTTTTTVEATTTTTTTAA